ncbi:hypothetical protein Tco_1116839 [Tanacetum coccineum]
MKMRIGSPRARRPRGRMVEFEDAPNKDGSKTEDCPMGGGHQNTGCRRRREPWREPSSFDRSPFGKEFDGEDLYWCEAMEMATCGALNDNKEVLISSTKVFHGTTTKERIRTGIVKILREILATEKAIKAFEPPPRMVRNRRSRDMFKYCHFYEDPRNKMNQYRELRHQTKEAMKSGQLAHLVKGLKKVKAKTSDKRHKDIVTVGTLILVIHNGDPNLKRKTTSNVLAK